MSQWKNLDQVAAKWSQEIVKDSQEIVKDQEKKKTELENWITKALGILQENGVYAMALYLLSQSEKERPLTRDVILKNLLNLFTDDSLGSLRLKADVENFGTKLSPKMVLQFFSDKICDDLDRLLLVKSLYEQVLIYARYGAKALEKVQEITT